MCSVLCFNYTAPTRSYPYLHTRSLHDTLPISANPPVAPKFAPKAQPSGATGVLGLADGTILWGVGYGASGAAVGEICFNTSMTGYQEILTDPSYEIGRAHV